MKYIPYNKNLLQYSRNLRNKSTMSEILLWKHLKCRKMKGFLFNRQKPLLNYIVDFYCHQLKLVIEIDGSIHRFQKKKDRIRQEKLESYGLHFLRFDDAEVKNDINRVVRRIEEWIEKNESDVGKN